VHEQRVVRVQADDADLDLVLGVPAGEAVDDVELVARVEEVDRALPVDEEGLVGQLDVDVAPPDVLGRRLASTMRLSFGERPVFAPERAISAPLLTISPSPRRGLLVEDGGLRVAEHVGDLDAVLGQIERGHGWWGGGAAALRREGGAG
jgi:hypothetical protein